MKTLPTVLPQEQNGHSSGSSGDRPQVQSLDTSLVQSSSHSTSPEPDSPTIQAKRARVEALWVMWKSQHKEHAALSQQRICLEQRKDKEQRERDAVMHQLLSTSQPLGLGWLLQRRAVLWENHLHDTTIELIEVLPQEKESEMVLEETNRLYRQAVDEKYLAILEKERRLKEEELN